MKWVRCPRCRTVNDVDRYAMCDGCSGDLTGLPPATTPPSAVTRERERDSSATHRILWGLAVAALVGTFLLPAPGSILTALMALILLAGLFVDLGIRGVRSTRLHPLFKFLAGLAAVAAGLAGAFILVAIACSGPINRGRW